MVLAAAGRPSPDADTALARLCEQYWYPLYAYLRRHGCSADQAQDFTQAFFAHVLKCKHCVMQIRPAGDSDGSC